ncbi:MAG: hypothetical protein ACHQYP_09035 [Nitrospiria bacterium]
MILSPATRNRSGSQLPSAKSRDLATGVPSLLHTRDKYRLMEILPVRSTRSVGQRI